MSGLRFATLLGRLCRPAVELEDVLAGKWTLEPIEELRGRIDLIVVLPLGKTVISSRYSSTHVAVSGMRTKPYSIIAVCAWRRMILSHVG